MLAAARGIRLLPLFVSLVFIAACDDVGTTATDGGGSDAGSLLDSDGDTITDEHEGAAERVDTDLDGVPDYLDTDSDGDGISDRDEAGDESLATRPEDADSDLTPNFRDADSDDNGISDTDEGVGDNDGDGIPDFRDLDDDNDLVRDAVELAGFVDPPADTDDDGVPNFRDPDSDGDGILDGDEYPYDTDRDGLFDWEDLDTDGDGIPDEEEAGDDDLRSPPIDTDGDGVPDFRDADSDNDGLSDRDEVLRGTSPTAADSDRDGVSDLIEVAAGTDPLDGAVSPRTRGDFVFVVPYMEPATPARDTLGFRTNIQFADIYFLFDASGSMSGSIGALRGAVGTLIGDLTCTDSGIACTSDSECSGGQVCSAFSGTCIEDPGTSRCLLSPYTGAGYYEAEYRNLLSLQPSAAATSTALGFTTFGGTENLYRATWGVADPVASPGVEVDCAAPAPGFIGCPAFREDAVRILVTFTDEDSDGSETPMQAGDALYDAGVTFIGVWAGTPGNTQREALVNLAVASRSLSSTRAPLVYDGSDASVVPAVTAAINEIVEGVPLRITIEAADEPGDAGDALPFIDHLETNTSGGRCPALGALEDTDGDGFSDAFAAVLPGTPVCWDVIPAQNDTVEPSTEPLVFRARLTVRGDGSPLDSRIVYFLVPPRIEMPGGPD